MSPILNKANTFNGQSLMEEIFNAASHGLGAMLSVAALVILVIFAHFGSDTMGMVSSILYGSSLILLYSCSTLYHAVTSRKAKTVFQIIDHCSIFLLIWGTYVPVALSLIGGTRGWILFGVQTVCAVVGIILNAIDFKKWKKFSLALYLIMGWCVVVNAKMVLELIDRVGLVLLLGGGIAYTVGVYFYAHKNRHFSHFVWHIFVLAGSVTQFLFVLRCCL